ncbi:Conserved_hypothetical protein [Hexamita inflata]|uniref:Uncharacterized protein n=1 Tax=Hexamita inflata TaxID=28002 RepID=A0AA86N7X3_9EUKA|nr:Conserved hypothetical protein [Hexamita inflata]
MGNVIDSITTKSQPYLSRNQLRNVFKYSQEENKYVCIDNNHLYVIGNRLEIYKQFKVNYPLTDGYVNEIYCNNHPCDICSYLNTPVICNNKIYIQCFEKIFRVSNSKLIYVTSIPELNLSFQSSFYRRLFAYNNHIFVQNNRKRVYVLSENKFKFVKLTNLNFIPTSGGLFAYDRFAFYEILNNFTEQILFTIENGKLLFSNSVTLILQCSTGTFTFDVFTKNLTYIQSFRESFVLGQIGLEPEYGRQVDENTVQMHWKYWNQAQNNPTLHNVQLMNVQKLKALNIYSCVEHNKLYIYDDKLRILSQSSVKYNFYSGFKSDKFIQNTDEPVHLYRSVLVKNQVFYQLFDKLLLLNNHKLVTVAKIPQFEQHFKLYSSWQSQLFSLGNKLYCISFNSLFVFDKTFKPMMTLVGQAFQFCDLVLVLQPLQLLLLNIDLTTTIIYSIQAQLNGDVLVNRTLQILSCMDGVMHLHNGSEDVFIDLVQKIKIDTHSNLDKNIQSNYLYQFTEKRESNELDFLVTFQIRCVYHKNFFTDKLNLIKQKLNQSELNAKSFKQRILNTHNSVNQQIGRMTSTFVNNFNEQNDQ